MRVTFKSIFRTIMAFLAIAFAYSLWAGTQTDTNLTTVAPTNQSSVLLREVEQLDRGSPNSCESLSARLRERFGRDQNG